MQWSKIISLLFELSETYVHGFEVILHVFISQKNLINKGALTQSVSAPLAVNVLTSSDNKVLEHI